jgi:purine-nucleoside phosphorylase
MSLTPLSTIHPAAKLIRRDLPAIPVVALVCGSGFVHALQSYPLAVWNVADLPCVPPISVQGHGHTIELHILGGSPTLVFTGRYHLYEGHTSAAVGTHIDIAHGLSIRRILLTNSAGGLRSNLSAGDIVVLRDVIDATNVPMQMISPHRPASPPLHRPTAERIGFTLSIARCEWHEGTYAQVLGPNYETRAEVRMLRRMGADCVGMSTVREAIYAASLGMTVAAISLITNVASDVRTPCVDHMHVLDVSRARASQMASVIDHAIQALATSS